MLHLLILPMYVVACGATYDSAVVAAAHLLDASVAAEACVRSSGVPNQTRHFS